MKRILLSSLGLAAILLLATSVHAQQVSKDKIDMHGTPASGFVAICQHNATDVSAVMTSELEKAGLKRRGSNKKFYTVRGAEWTAISPGKLDVYYKVVKKKKRAKILF